MPVHFLVLCDAQTSGARSLLHDGALRQLPLQLLLATCTLSLGSARVSTIRRWQQQPHLHQAEPVSYSLQLLACALSTAAGIQDA